MKEQNIAPRLEIDRFVTLKALASALIVTAGLVLLPGNANAQGNVNTYIPMISGGLRSEVPVEPVEPEIPVGVVCEGQVGIPDLYRDLFVSVKEGYITVQAEVENEGEHYGKTWADQGEACARFDEIENELKIDSAVLECRYFDSRTFEDINNNGKRDGEEEWEYHGSEAVSCEIIDYYDEQLGNDIQMVAMKDIGSDKPYAGFEISNVKVSEDSLSATSQDVANATIKVDIGANVMFNKPGYADDSAQSAAMETFEVEYRD